ncbi:pectate lyase P358 [Paenibacillus mucilaginosus 3016]|uniref:Pectate lyase P358 n=1 Tax=Paenibacillus mucilaginosus 3016 TaxID=1116391 RepID=H6NK98_9BACL|nr:pectate lyase [Paenibacillus mucilaginosus]AFC31582.1 pectate lyase P358 [Paenibacillus mucilaginosus 3016]WFA20120.1 pectate lyase [Paenibacillus mucilaginosus]
MTNQSWHYRRWLTAFCAASLLLSAAPSALRAEEAGQGTAEPVRIVQAKALTPTTIQFTLSGKLNSLQPSDFEVQAALGDWNSLNPQLTGAYTVKSASLGTDHEGRSIVTLETEQGLNPDATFTRTPAENPKSVPYLNASYYTGDRTADIQQADNLLTWQMDHGGWYKMGDKYKRAWNGTEAKSDWKAPDGTELGTIDNNATTNEILFLSVMYKETGDERYRDAVLRGFEFLEKLQYASGGWAQVYPSRGNYSDYVTFNDNAMMRVMNVLKMARDRQYPFNSSLLPEESVQKLQASLDRGLDYILKSQIRVNGKLTAWCAQHDPLTYEARGARAYEHPSISGSESIEIIKYLMALPEQTPEVKQAADSALAYFEASKLSGIKYVSADPNNVYFVPDPATDTWYRFYDIATNLPIFSGRDGVIKHNILEIEAERRNGYRWAGSWAQKLLAAVKSTGYYEGRVYVKIAGSASETASGSGLAVGDLERIEDAIRPSLTLVEPGRKTGNHYNVDGSSIVLKGAVSEKAAVQVNGAAASVGKDLGYDSGELALQPGRNEFTVTAVDAAGNPSEPLQVNVVPTGKTGS